MYILYCLGLFDLGASGIEQPCLCKVRFRHLEHGGLSQSVDLEALRVTRCKRIADYLVIQRRGRSRNGIKLRISLRKLRQRRHERPCIRVSRVVEYLVHITEFHYLTGVHDRNAVRDVCNNAQIMGDEHDSIVKFLPQILEKLEYLRLDRNVKCGRRLVAYKDLRLAGQCYRYNMALYDLEYTAYPRNVSWTKIPAGGEETLTGILDKPPTSATEKITLYVRKADAGSEAAATEIKIPVRPKKPDPIQITNVTKDSYSIRVKGQPVSGCEYGISESADGELQWQTGKTFTSPKPAHTYYITLRVKATENSFASKPADRLEVTTPDALLIDGPAGKVSFETTGTYGQTLDQMP